MATCPGTDNTSYQNVIYFKINLKVKTGNSGNRYIFTFHKNEYLRIELLKNISSKEIILN